MWVDEQQAYQEVLDLLQNGPASLLGHEEQERLRAMAYEDEAFWRALKVMSAVASAGIIEMSQEREDMKVENRRPDKDAWVRRRRSIVNCLMDLANNWRPM